MTPFEIMAGMKDAIDSMHTLLGELEVLNIEAAEAECAYRKKKNTEMLESMYKTVAERTAEAAVNSASAKEKAMIYSEKLKICYEACRNARQEVSAYQSMLNIVKIDESTSRHGA